MMRVLDVLTDLFCGKYGCDPENVTMGATLDELNLAPHERRDTAAVLEELYGVFIDETVQNGWETVEDVVGTVEDELNRREMEG